MEMIANTDDCVRQGESVTHNKASRHTKRQLFNVGTLTGSLDDAERQHSGGFSSAIHDFHKNLTQIEIKNKFRHTLHAEIS